MAIPPAVLADVGVVWILRRRSSKSTRDLPPLVGVLFAAKCAITYALLRTGIGFRRVHGHRSTSQVVVLVVVAGLLGLAFSLPVPNLFSGQMPPNQFHNTTTWVLIPFALWTFWAACTYMRHPSRRSAGWVASRG